MSTAFAHPTPPASPPRAARNGFTAQQRQVICLLAQGASVTKAAQETGIHRTTINHWQRSNPLFLLELERARQEIAAKLRDQYLSLAPLAMNALRDLLSSPKTPAATRLKAITLVLNAAMAEVDPAHLHPEVETAIHQNSSLSTDEETTGPESPFDSSVQLPIDQNSSQLSQFFAEMEESVSLYGDLEGGNDKPIHQSSSLSPILPYRSGPKTGRNAPCPCGSGQKFKRCCLRNRNGLGATA